MDEDDEGKQEAYYQSLREKIPEEFRDFDFNKLIHNRLELDHFRQFLGMSSSLIDVKFAQRMKNEDCILPNRLFCFVGLFVSTSVLPSL